MSNISDYVKLVSAAAYSMEKTHKIPALFIMAQGALESGWGSHAIGNNLFGITCPKAYTGMKKLVLTTEFLKDDFAIGKTPNHPHFEEVVSKERIESRNLWKYKLYRWFKDYATLEDCLYDHAKILLLPRYKKAFDYCSDPEKFAVEIEKGGYATGGNYAVTIVKIMNMIRKYL